MAEAMTIDETTPLPSKKSLKRKREKELLSPEERETRLKTLNDELNSLINYFNEVLSSNVDLGLCSSGDISNTSLNSMVAVLLEEKRCSYPKLAGEIYEKLKERDGNVTISSVRGSVLFVGQRIAYGVTNDNVDVLENEDDSCLWCWETRDMKLLPNSLRGTLKVRRSCRKKINERIIAIQDVISSLQISEDHPSCKHNMSKAADKLSKVLSEADIRLLVESLARKNDSEMAEKEAKKKGTTLIKELEKNKREIEKEKKRMELELQKEKLQSEKEKKRLQLEADRDEKRLQKEEAEMRKQLKRKQEEADREQRRKERDEAELKKQLAVQKQASIMERFLKKSRIASVPHKDQSASIVALDSGVNRENTCESVTQLIDSALKLTHDVNVVDIRKSHMNSWRLLGHSIHSNRQHWGMRQKSKTELIKELKLTSNGVPARDDDMCVDNLVDGWGETNTDGKSSHDNTSVSSRVIGKCLRRKQLLQFDKSNRPAFYGIWPKKSSIIGSRHPFTKDPDLDYEIDSDEEWEEEEPGESLSDSEKEEEENLKEGSCKGDDEDGSEDGFFVPDGYLSENEGVENDRSQSGLGDGDTYNSACCKPEAESEESSVWARQQKYLHNLTEHALRKNQPLVIINLMHEKTHLLSAEDLSGTLKVEQTCLQALSMRAFPGELCIEVPSNVNLQEENQEASTSNCKGIAVATGIATIIPDSDLPKIVSVIQSHPQGLSKVLESLLQKFPDVPKSHLRNKVREISDFVDNRWQVKKEILDKLGMTTPPEKGRKKTKGIATFFSKRCLPPAGKVINLCDSSPESMKPGSSSQQQRKSTENF